MIYWKRIQVMAKKLGSHLSHGRDNKSIGTRPSKRVMGLGAYYLCFDDIL